MLAYGERRRVVEPRSALQAVAKCTAQLGRSPAGLAFHAALAEAFLDLAGIAQGLADAAFERCGEDDLSEAQQAAMSALAAFAGPLAASWRSGFAGLSPLDPAPLSALAALTPDVEITVKTPEGHAFYAVYPEAYAQAAAALPPQASVIGLRTIGVSLAAAAAAGAGAAPALTVRPTGHPFDRALSLSPRLEAHLLARREGPFVIADEGPGLSGSSFAGAARWLETRGVAADRIVFMPSHKGEPGPMAGAQRLRRWAGGRRLVRDLDDLLAERPLAAWVEDLVGPALGPPEDLSGGAWRALRHGDDPSRWPPAHPAQERRKFLLRTARGPVLVKFTGLGRLGREKTQRAMSLGRAGFTPQPLGFRHGFLVEPWLCGRPLDLERDRKPLLERLAAYLPWRTRAFPAGPNDGASLDELKAMVEANAAEALGRSSAQALARRFPRDLTLRPIRVDARLHAWEWLWSGGRLLKTDAVDHDDAHDLVGCQDVAWDVAGAEAEFGLTPRELQRLVQGLEAADCPVRPDALAFMRLAYPAFQLGLWTFAAQAADAQDQRLIRPLLEGYARRLDALASGQPLGAAQARGRAAPE